VTCYRVRSIRSRIVHGGSLKKGAPTVAGLGSGYDDVVLRVSRLARKFGTDARRRVLADDVDMHWNSRLNAFENSPEGGA
jgi:hypothetical protein